MNSLLGKIGRYVYALPFGVFGLFHFMNAGQMAGWVPGFIPGGEFWIYLTGLAHLAACVSIIIEKKTRLACLLLGVMLIIFVLTIHLPGAMGGGEGSMTSMINVLKDTGLAGGAWILGSNYEAESPAPTTGSHDTDSPGM